MTFEYYPETGTLYIGLRNVKSADTSEVAEDVTLDFDHEGVVIGLTVEHASKRADLKSLHATNIPSAA